MNFDELVSQLEQANNVNTAIAIGAGVGGGILLSNLVNSNTTTKVIASTALVGGLGYLIYKGISEINSK